MADERDIVVAPNLGSVEELAVEITTAVIGSRDISISDFDNI
ncbi:hypothetical protein [Methylorubrum extorquens]